MANRLEAGTSDASTNRPEKATRKPKANTSLLWQLVLNSPFCPSHGCNDTAKGLGFSSLETRLSGALELVI